MQRVLSVKDSLQSWRETVLCVAERTSGKSVSTVHRELEKAVAGRYTSGRYVSAWRSYCRAVEARNTSPRPVTLMNLKVWLHDYMYLEGKSSSSLGSLISRVQMFCHASHIEIPSWETKERTRWIELMTKACPAPATKKSLVLTLAQLKRVAELLTPSTTPLSGVPLVDLTMYVSIFMAAKAGMRIGELVNGRLSARDVELIAPQEDLPLGGIVVSKLLAKTAKKDLTPQRVVATELAGVPRLIPALTQLATRAGVQFDGVNAGVVFRDWNNTVKPLTYEKWTRRFHHILRDVGVKQEKRYTGHGLRAAAATMASNSGLTQKEVMEAFGWKSKAVAGGYNRATTEMQMKSQVQTSIRHMLTVKRGAH